MPSFSPPEKMTTTNDVYQMYEANRVRLVEAAEALKTEESQTKSRITKLGKQQAELEDLRKRLADAGAKTDEIDERLRAVQEKLAESKATMESLPAKAEALKAEVTSAEPSLWLLRMARDLWKMEAIPRVQSLAEFYPALSLDLDFKGTQLKSVKLEARSFAPNFEANLSVAAKIPRVSRASIPEAVWWLPAPYLTRLVVSVPEHRYAGVQRQQIRQCDSISIPEVIYFEPEQRLVPSRSKIQWQTKNANYHGNQWGRSEPEHLDHSRSLEAELPSLASRFAALFKDISTLDLDAEHPDGSIFGFLQQKVLEATIPETEHPFPSASEVIRSEEIFQRIVPYWTGFVRGPWLPGMIRVFANLKYYCEQGERPRFYNLGVEGLYGFRLRTRDHSWIVGKVYLRKGQKGGSPVEDLSKQPVEVHGANNDTAVFSLGPLFVQIADEEWIHRPR
jgi:hypothetical protein